LADKLQSTPGSGNPRYAADRFMTVLCLISLLAILYTHYILHITQGIRLGKTTQQKLLLYKVKASVPDM